MASYKYSSNAVSTAPKKGTTSPKQHNRSDSGVGSASEYDTYDTSAYDHFDNTPSIREVLRTKQAEIDQLKVQLKQFEAELKLYQGEQRELQTESKALEAENKGLQTENKELQSTNKDLQNANKELRREIRDMEKGYHEICEDKEKMKRESDRMRKQRDDALEEVKKVTADSKLLAADNKTLAAENKALAAENKGLSGENKGLAADNKALASDNKALASDNKTLTANNKTLATDNESLDTENKNLAANNKSLSSENKKLAAENGRLSDDNNRLSEKNSKLRDTLSQYNDYLDTLGDPNEKKQQHQHHPVAAIRNGSEPSSPKSGKAQTVKFDKATNEKEAARERESSHQEKSRKDKDRAPRIIHADSKRDRDVKRLSKRFESRDDKSESSGHSGRSADLYVEMTPAASNAASRRQRRPSVVATTASIGPQYIASSGIMSPLEPGYQVPRTSGGPNGLGINSPPLSGYPTPSATPLGRRQSVSYATVETGNYFPHDLPAGQPVPRKR